jgi:hypothetical protein
MDKVTGDHPFGDSSTRRPCVRCHRVGHDARAHKSALEALLQVDAALRAGNIREAHEWVGVARNLVDPANRRRQP